MSHVERVRRMPRLSRAVVWFAALLLLAVPGVAAAQSTMTDNDSVLVAVDRDVVIDADDRVGTLVVVSGNATVSGHVETVVVVDGTLTVDGTVGETVVAVNTDVTLGATAVVEGDVVIASGELTRDPAATIGGSVTRNFDLRIGWALTLISILFWVGITIGLLIAGLVLVAFARGQVMGVGDLLTGEAGSSILATVILVVGLPIVVIAAFLSVIGIPVGLALLVVVLPLLWMIGYLVAGARVGRLVLGAGGAGESTVSPYLAVLLGVLLFQIVGLIPGIGALAIWLAATYGAGGLVLYAWRSWRRGSGTPAAPVA